jgi:hypothetical protein
VFTLPGVGQFKWIASSARLIGAPW